WGSDVHAPAGDVELARKIKADSEKSGIGTVSYGSYFRVGVNPNEEFPKYLESAKALGSSVIRIWAYRSVKATEGEEWERVVCAANEICKMAEPYGIKICLECHNGSITEDYNTALAYLKAVNHELFGMYWQPNQLKSLEYNIDAAKALAPYVEALHVFHFINNEKAPLSEGISDWQKYLAIIKEVLGDKSIPAYLEFMPDDKIETLDREAETLNKLLEEFN
ncbi:MAG: TIM barrel protein, partial [Clostridia bacterium]|nr:TIM barrel protein [Clostridia bacterium]